MKIFISADIEGATGVIHRDQLMPEGKTYIQACKFLTEDINAAIRGALRVKPDAEFVVADGHGVMRNVLLEALHEAAQLVTGPASFENRPLCQSQGIDRSFDLAFFVGYHSKVGTQSGVLSHTWVGSTIADFCINGKSVGETGINGAVAGSFDIPVGLIVGNHELESEARDTLPGDFVFVSTKRSLGPSAALCLPPAKTSKLIEDGAEEAVNRFLADKLEAFKPASPVCFEVQTYRREMADKACDVPGIERVSDFCFSVKAENGFEAARITWQGVVRAQEKPADWLL